VIHCVELRNRESRLQAILQLARVVQLLTKTLEHPQPANLRLWIRPHFAFSVHSAVANVELVNGLKWWYVVSEPKVPRLPDLQRAALCWKLEVVW